MTSSKENAREIDLWLDDEEFESLQKALKATQWVELPFRDSAIILEERWNQRKNKGVLNVKDKDFFFAPEFMLQSTAEDRWQLPMTKMLGFLFHLETEMDNEERDKSWFESTVENIFTVMKGLPPEHDAAFVGLLRAVIPSEGKIKSSAARTAAYARNKETNQQRLSAVAEWEANGHEYSSMRAFARTRYKEYGVTDYMTVYNWLRDSRKSKI